MLRPSSSLRWPRLAAASLNLSGASSGRPQQAWLARAKAREPPQQAHDADMMQRARCCPCQIRPLSSFRPEAQDAAPSHSRRAARQTRPSTRYYNVTKKEPAKSSKGKERIGGSSEDPAAENSSLRKLNFEASRQIGRLVNRVHQAKSVEGKHAAYDVLLMHFEKRTPRRLKQGDAILWNQLITGAISAGKQKDAFKLYNQMKKTGVQPSPRTYVAFFRGLRILQKQGVEISVGLVDGLVEDLHKLRSMVTGEVVAVSLARDVQAGSALFPPASTAREVDDVEWYDLRLSTPASRMRMTRNKVVRATQADWSPLLQAYVLAIPLLAHMRQEEKAWQVYAELSRRSPATGKSVRPFPHKAIFSSILAGLWGQLGTGAKMAASADKRSAALTAPGLLNRTTTWKHRLLAIITTWIEELKRVQTNDLHERFVESIQMDAVMLFQAVRVLHMIDTPDAAAVAIDIFQQIIGWVPAQQRQIWTNAELVRSTMHRTETPAGEQIEGVPARELYRLLEQCWEKSEQKIPWEEVKGRFAETLTPPNWNSGRADGAAVVKHAV